MTRFEAERRTVELLDHFNIQGWMVWVVMTQSEWVELFPNNPDAVGMCSHRRMTIFLNERYIYNDVFTEETIEHEIAHVLQPLDTETHGVEFEQKLVYVRAGVRMMDLIKNHKLYPDDGKPSPSYYLRHPGAAL